MTHDDHNQTPPELEGLSDALDALARADREAAPRDLATRLARAGIETEPPSVIARIGGSGSAGGVWRIAAVVALGAIGVTGVMLMSQNSAAPPITPTGSDIDVAALASEGAEVLRTAYASGVTIAQGDADSLWSLGGENAPGAPSDGASLWDLGADAFEDDIDWSNFEEVL